MSFDPSRLIQTEYANQAWTLTVEAKTTMEDVLKPEFFSNVAIKMRPYDRVHVRVDTGDWYAEVLVVSCGRAWAKVIKLLEVKLVDANADAMADDVLDKYTIEHRGAHLKFCVVRRSDKEPIKENCASKAEAQGWLTSYLLTQ